jgi:hypothetical protein
MHTKIDGMLHHNQVKDGKYLVEAWNIRLMGCYNVVRQNAINTINSISCYLPF